MRHSRLHSMSIAMPSPSAMGANTGSPIVATCQYHGSALNHA